MAKRIALWPWSSIISRGRWRFGMNYSTYTSQVHFTLFLLAAWDQYHRSYNREVYKMMWINNLVEATVAHYLRRKVPRRPSSPFRCMQPSRLRYYIGPTFACAFRIQISWYRRCLLINPKQLSDRFEPSWRLNTRKPPFDIHWKAQNDDIRRSTFRPVDFKSLERLGKSDQNSQKLKVLITHLSWAQSAQIRTGPAQWTILPTRFAAQD